LAMLAAMRWAGNRSPGALTCAKLGRLCAGDWLGPAAQSSTKASRAVYSV
jgi:hypothetical protein